MSYFPGTPSPGDHDDQRQAPHEGTTADDPGIAGALPPLQWSGDPVEEPTATLAPLSADRVADSLARMEFVYFKDSEGDIGGQWDGHTFYFFVTGSENHILSIRTQWHRKASIDRLSDMLDACNTWNMEKLWPKALVRVDDSGYITVVGDTVTPFQFGVSDEQMDVLLRGAVATGLSLIEHLDEMFPDPIRSAP